MQAKVGSIARLAVPQLHHASFWLVSPLGHLVTGSGHRLPIYKGKSNENTQDPHFLMNESTALIKAEDAIAHAS